MFQNRLLIRLYSSLKAYLLIAFQGAAFQKKNDARACTALFVYYPSAIGASFNTAADNTLF